MIRKIIYSLIILGFFIFCSKRDENIHAEPSNIIVRYLTWELYTALPIPCEQMEVSKYKEFKISDENIIAELNTYLSDFKIIELEKKIDTRIKLLIDYEGHIKGKVCIGNNGIMELNGKKIEYNYDLEKFSRKLIVKYDSIATTHIPQL